jgi:hypothetical protein
MGKRAGWTKKSPGLFKSRMLNALFKFKRVVEHPALEVVI